MKRKALSILIKDIVRKNLGLIIILSILLIYFIVWIHFCIYYLRLLEFPIFPCFILSIVFCLDLLLELFYRILSTIKRWKKEYNSILANLKEENK